MHTYIITYIHTYVQQNTYKDTYIHNFHTYKHVPIDEVRVYAYDVHGNNTNNRGEIEAGISREIVN